MLRNPHAVADKRSRVQKMFANIAPSYDLNNRLHSLWQDQKWRKRAIEIAQIKPSDNIVDVACGTGDLALLFEKCFARWRAKARKARKPFTQGGGVMGIDFTYEMLAQARQKQLEPYWKIFENPEEMGLEPRDFNPSATLWINGDAQSLPLPDTIADVVSIAFGIRNVQDVPTALKEFHRVLRPGGRVIILEFSLPTNPILRSLYNFYFRQILPRTATLISGDKTGAYKYLPESVNTFIGREQMMQMMGDAGFVDVEQFPMTFGVCVCYRGVKQ